jgi:hypothetical protein
LSQLAGVIRVHPFGHNGKVLVYVADKSAFTEEAVKKALVEGTAELRLRKMERAAG